MHSIFHYLPIQIEVELQKKKSNFMRNRILLVAGDETLFHVDTPLGATFAVQF